MGFFCYIHKQTSNKSYYLNESQTQIEKVVLNAATPEPNTMSVSLSAAGNPIVINKGSSHVQC